MDGGWTSNLSDDEPDVDPEAIALKEAGAARADAVFWNWRDTKETKQTAFRCKKKGNKTVRTWLLEVILG